MERAADFGLDGLHCVERQLVERQQQPQADEHELAALGERHLEVDGFGVDAGQQVVGEDDLLLGAGLELLAGGFLVEHSGREAGRATERSVSDDVVSVVQRSFPQ